MDKENNKNYILELNDKYKSLLEQSFKAYDLYSKYVNKTRKKSLKKYTDKVELRKLKRNIREFQSSYDKKYNTDGSSYDSIMYEVIRLDHMYNLGVYKKINEIKFEEDIYKKRRLLIRIQEIYSELFLISFKTQSKANINSIYNLKMFFQEKQQAAKRKIEKIKKEERIEKEKEKREEEKSKRIIKTNKILDLSDINALNNASLEKVLNAYREEIRHGKITKELVSYLSAIIKRLVVEDDSKYNELLYSILDSIRYRKNEVYKDEETERNILRVCSTTIKRYVDMINTLKNETEEHDYRFDLFFELLRSKDNYLAVKKLLKEYPEIKEVRNNKKCIPLYILMLYINNYNSIINEKKYYYNIDYLKAVYELLIKDNDSLTIEDENEINEVLDTFINSIMDSDINSKRKNYIIEEAKELYLDRSLRVNNHKKIDDIRLTKDIQDILFLDPNHTTRASEKDLTHEHTFKLDNDYICYSFIEEKGKKTLKIHTVDVSNLVDEGSALDNHLYNGLLDNKKMDNFILSACEFKDGDKISALTYEIDFDDFRTIKDFKVYRSKIKVDGKLLDYASDPYIYQNMRRLVTDFESESKKEVPYSGLKKIEYVINEILNVQYLKRINGDRLPVIGSKEEVKETMPLNVLSDLTCYLNRIPKDDHKKIARMMMEDSTQEFFTSDVPYKKDFNIHITGEPDYLYLLNQRMIKTFILNELSSYNPNIYPRVKEKYEDIYDNLIKTLNDKIDYKTEEDFDYKKRRKFKSYILKNEE